MSGLLKPCREQPRKQPKFLLVLSLLVLRAFLGSAPLSAAEPVQVIVQGIEGDILANVSAALALPPGVVKDGKVNIPWLERFRDQAPEKVHAALEPFGYYSPQISVELETPDEKSHILRVTVLPGKPAIVNDLKVTVYGPGAAELKGLAASFPLRQGDILRHYIYEEAKGALKARAAGLGYLDADYRVHQVLVSKEKFSASIILELETGPRYFFGEVSFEDGKIYPERFLRRYVAFKPGEVFSPLKLSVTQLNLVNSDRFKDIVISPEEERAENLRVPVTIRLEPSPPKRLRMGVGYGTDTGPRFSLQYRDLNFFRRGHEFDAELGLSQHIQGIAAGYTWPGATVDGFTGLKINFIREDVSAYETRLFSVEANRTRSLGRGRLGTAYIRLLQEDSNIGSDDVSAKLVLPGLRFSEQRYDDVIRPRKGHSYAVELRGTTTLIGSDFSLVQVLAEGNMLVQLPWRLSFRPRIKGGATFLGDDMSELPASLRFFAGGDRSVRGYSYQSLGPKDSHGDVIGGKHLLVGSLEIERAIREDAGIAIFYDVGNSFNSLNDITLFQGAGVGFRYYTKVGAISLDVARQIGVDNPDFRLHFTLGYEL